MMDLFSQSPAPSPKERIAEGAWLLPGLALHRAQQLVDAIAAIAAVSPFRRMTTRGGFVMGVEMTNCGLAGWVSDRKGYRYQSEDPVTGQPWPALPPAFLTLSSTAAREVGFDGFVPDVCLINRYHPGVKMSPHQDRDEQDFGHPIVSVSLGLPAVFQFGGFERSDPLARYRLEHGDVVVWGGPARLRYHGITALKAGDHPLTGALRLNLTFRKAL